MAGSLELLQESINIANRPSVSEVSAHLKSIDPNSHIPKGSHNTVYSPELPLQYVLYLPILGFTNPHQGDVFFKATTENRLVAQYADEYLDPEDTRDYEHLEIRMLPGENKLLDKIDGSHRAESRLVVVSMLANHLGLSEAKIIATFPYLLRVPANVSGASYVEAQRDFALKNVHLGVKSNRIIRRMLFRYANDPPWGTEDVDGLFTSGSPPDLARVLGFHDSMVLPPGLLNVRHPQAAAAHDKIIRWAQDEITIWTEKSSFSVGTIGKFARWARNISLDVLDEHAVYQPEEGTSPFTDKLYDDLGSNYSIVDGTYGKRNAELQSHIRDQLRSGNRSSIHDIADAYLNNTTVVPLSSRRGGGGGTRRRGSVTPASVAKEIAQINNNLKKIQEDIPDAQPDIQERLRIALSTLLRRIVILGPLLDASDDPGLFGVINFDVLQAIAGGMELDAEQRMSLIRTLSPELPPGEPAPFHRVDAVEAETSPVPLGAILGALNDSLLTTKGEYITADDIHLWWRAVSQMRELGVHGDLNADPILRSDRGLTIEEREADDELPPLFMDRDDLLQEHSGFARRPTESWARMVVDFSPYSTDYLDDLYRTINDPNFRGNLGGIATMSNLINAERTRRQSVEIGAIAGGQPDQDPLANVTDGEVREMIDSILGVAYVSTDFSSFAEAVAQKLSNSPHASLFADILMSRLDTYGKFAGYLGYILDGSGTVSLPNEEEMPQIVRALSKMESDPVTHEALDAEQNARRDALLVFLRAGQ